MSTKYTLLTASSENDLEEYVNSALQRGWKVQGGASASVSTKRVKHRVGGAAGVDVTREAITLVYSQAMTKSTKRPVIRRRGRGVGNPYRSGNKRPAG